MNGADTASVEWIGRSRYALAANGLTVGRLVLAPILGWMIVDEAPRWPTFLLALALGASDFFDGRLARNATPTRVGAFVDPLADKAVVLIAGFALVDIGRFPMFPWVVIAVREIGIQLYRSWWARRGLAIPARPSAKYKVFVQGLAIALALCPWLDGVPAVADAMLWLAVAFTVVSGAQYLADGRDALRTTGIR